MHEPQGLCALRSELDTQGHMTHMRNPKGSNSQKQRRGGCQGPGETGRHQSNGTTLLSARKSKF